MLVYTNDAYYKDIANAIREKTGGEETYLPSEMGDGVRAIQSGGTDGQFFPMEVLLPIATAEYNGGAI